MKKEGENVGEVITETAYMPTSKIYSLDKALKFPGFCIISLDMYAKQEL